MSGTLKKPLIKYSNLELSGSVKSGEPFEISATIENLSSYNLLPEVKVYYDRTINSKVIPLGDGESRKVAFTIKLDETGDHKVSIGSLSPKNVNVKIKPA